jgi:hypothetical protein
MAKEEVFSKFIWSIGGLTEVIGQMHCSTTNEATQLHWHDDENYWFTLEMCEDDIYAEIDDSTDAKTMYAAIGYCQYHGISYSLIWQDYRKEKSNG